jgi:uncharacterized protein YyaL (SSP411 family)
VALLNLLKLYEYMTRDDYRIRAGKMLSLFLGGAAAQPLALSEMLLALDFYTDRVKEIVIVTPAGRMNEAESYLQEFRKKYLPNHTLSVVSSEKELAAHAGIVPLVQNKSAVNGKTTAYICENGTCQLPALTPAYFARQLREIEKYPQPGLEK